MIATVKFEGAAPRRWVNRRWGVIIPAVFAFLLLAAAQGWAAADGAESVAAPVQPGNIAVQAPASEPAPAAVAGFRLTHFDAGSKTLLFDGIVFLVTLPILWWMLHRPHRLNEITSPGFEIITESETRRFIPLEGKFQHMDFLNSVETRGSLRLSANLNKVNLSFRRFGHLLEDKNFRNALLVNRRRVRRTLLKDGDVLDMGDLTLLYRDDRQMPIVRHSAVTPREGKVQVRFDRPRGPVRKGTPTLISESQPNRSFFVTKNLVFIGRSESNDLVIKSRNIDYRHAKIERVGSKYKLLNLSTAGNTFINNRRVEQRILKEGDEISFDNQRFKYRLASRTVNEPPGPRAGQGEGMDEESETSGNGENQSRAAEQERFSNAGG